MKNRLMQLVADNAGRGPQALAISASDAGATVYLYDVIDAAFGVSAAEFGQAMADLKGQPVALRINSPGGDVFDGRAMATAVAEHGNVTAWIDGLAASAATYVALAAAEVRMAAGAFFMIHNAWTMAVGDKNDLIETADLLEKIDATLVADYARKTGLPGDEIVAMMNAETWLSADEAWQMKFVDAVVDAPAAAAKWNLSAYTRAPAALAVLAAMPVLPNPEPLPGPAPDARAMARAARRLRLYRFG